MTEDHRIWQVGDLVVHRSGGPVMSIISADQTANLRTKLRVSWFSAGDEKTAVLNPEEIVLVGVAP